MNSEPQRDQPETALVETALVETITVPAQANAVTAAQADVPGRHARILIL